MKKKTLKDEILQGLFFLRRANGNSLLHVMGLTEKFKAPYDKYTKT